MDAPGCNQDFGSLPQRAQVVEFVKRLPKPVLSVPYKTLNEIAQSAVISW